MEEVSGILLFHIQLMIVINHKLIGQCQIVTVGIYLFGIKRINYYFLTHMPNDFSSG